MLDDALDRLYRTAPGDFVALRTELSAAARKRGDAEAARRLRAARRPTVAAWLVNRLVLGAVEGTSGHGGTAAGVADRLGDLGARLRAAHAAGDGEALRALSAEQRRLVAELTTAAVDGAGGDAGPVTAAVRGEVTATLTAAVADPAVGQQLGRLIAAQRWSGFAGLADARPATPVRRASAVVDRAAEVDSARAPRRERQAERATGAATRADTAAQRRTARAALAAAQRADDAAQARCDEAATAWADARGRHDNARERCAEVDRAVADADAVVARLTEALAAARDVAATARADGEEARRDHVAARTALADAAEAARTARAEADDTAAVLAAAREIADRRSPPRPSDRGRPRLR